MSKEKEIINLVTSKMPVSPLRKSNCFEVDAELIRLGDIDYLFTTDDFSIEDRFRYNNPYNLGWNLASASITDIIASAGKPLIYSHSLVVASDWTNEYIEKLSEGIGAVLKEYGVSFAGGDLSVSENWRYTASVIGLPVSIPLTRIGAKPGDIIYVSGEIGKGNLEAAISLYSDKKVIGLLTNKISNSFQCLKKLPALLSEFATCSIDTSDGLVSGLKTISELNGTGFSISNLPYSKIGLMAAKALKLPKTLLAAGECGEYEILFTVNPDREEELQKYSIENSIEIRRIGKVTIEAQWIQEKNVKFNMDSFCLSARDYIDVKEYLKHMIDWIKQNGSEYE